MTVVTNGLTRRDRGALGRWGASLALVLLVHAGAGLYLLRHPVAFAPAVGEPAVMLDLAPLPVAAPPQPAPPEPVAEPLPEPQPLPMVKAPPPPPEPEMLLPQVEPSPAPKPAVVLPKPPPKVKPKPVEPPPQAEPLRAPPPTPAVAAPTPPAPAVSAANAGAARASWQAQLVAWLQRYKRYPRLAQEQREEGVAYLRFTMDRSGRVLSAQIDRSSGHPLLDEEVSALIQRAQPLPTPPPEVPGAQITLSLPVQFSLRAGR
jgi:protein TonB